MIHVTMHINLFSGNALSENGNARMRFTTLLAKWLLYHSRFAVIDLLDDLLKFCNLSIFVSLKTMYSLRLVLDFVLYVIQLSVGMLVMNEILSIMLIFY